MYFFFLLLCWFCFSFYRKCSDSSCNSYHHHYYQSLLAHCRAKALSCVMLGNFIFHRRNFQYHLFTLLCFVIAIPLPFSSIYSVLCMVFIAQAFLLIVIKEKHPQPLLVVLFVLLAAYLSLWFQIFFHYSSISITPLFIYENIFFSDINSKVSFHGGNVTVRQATCGYLVGLRLVVTAHGHCGEM